MRRRDVVLAAWVFGAPIGCGTQNGQDGQGPPGSGGSSSGAGGTSSGSSGSTSSSGGSGGSTSGGSGSSGGSSSGMPGGSGGSGGSSSGSSSGSTSGGTGGSSSGSGGGDAGGPGGDAGGAGLAQWQYFAPITLDTTATGANVPGDVAKYPVAVVLGSANFDFSQAKPDGADVRFSLPDGTPLPFSIESWDATAKTAAAWVKVDVKGNDGTQSIVMSWGNPNAAAAGDAHAVFDTRDGFVGVWHLGETPGTTAGLYQDSTSNAANASGVNVDSSSFIDGRIGKAASLANAKKQWIRVDGTKNALFDIHDQMTYSIWTYARTHTVEYQAAFTKGETGFRMHYYGVPDWTENKGKNIVEICVEDSKSGDLCELKGGNANAGIGTDVAPGKWFHWVAVHDYPKLTLYLNGAVEVSNSEGGSWTSGAAQPVAIGNNPSIGSGARTWDGYLDEARFMNVVKDANWAKLEYESQREGQLFLKMAAAQKRF